MSEITGKPYGYELILDLFGCDVTKFNRADLEAFFVALCEEIDMEKCDVHFWDDVGVPEEEKQTDALLSELAQTVNEKAEKQAAEGGDGDSERSGRSATRSKSRRVKA